MCFNHAPYILTLAYLVLGGILSSSALNLHLYINYARIKLSSNEAKQIFFVEHRNKGTDLIASSLEMRFDLKVKLDNEVV